MSCASIAGWFSGKLSAPKLYHSCSASGPSCVVKPSSPKMAVISSITAETGCTAPCQVARAGIERSRAGALAFARAAISRSRAAIGSESAACSRLSTDPTSRLREGSAIVRRLAIRLGNTPCFRPTYLTRTRSSSSAVSTLSSSMRSFSMSMSARRRGSDSSAGSSSNVCFASAMREMPEDVNRSSLQ